MSGLRSWKDLVLRMGNYPLGRMGQNFAKGPNIWKGNGNTTTLFFLKSLTILLKKSRGQVNTIVMEHFNSIYFHSSGTANKQHTC